MNIAVIGPFWVEVSNTEHPFMAVLISRFRGTCLITLKQHHLITWLNVKAYDVHVALFVWHNSLSFPSNQQAILLCQSAWTTIDLLVVGDRWRMVTNNKHLHVCSTVCLMYLLDTYVVKRWKIDILIYHVKRWNFAIMGTSWGMPCCIYISLEHAIIWLPRCAWLNAAQIWTERLVHLRYPAFLTGAAMVFMVQYKFLFYFIHCALELGERCSTWYIHY